jgi:hypothetical protein
VALRYPRASAFAASVRGGIGAGGTVSARSCSTQSSIQSASPSSSSAASPRCGCGTRRSPSPPAWRSPQRRMARPSWRGASPPLRLLASPLYAAVLYPIVLRVPSRDRQLVASALRATSDATGNRYIVHSGIYRGSCLRQS